MDLNSIGNEIKNWMMTLLGITNSRAIFRKTTCCQVSLSFTKKFLSKVRVVRVAKEFWYGRHGV